MQNPTTLARPYALGLFQATPEDLLEKVARSLEICAQIASDPFVFVRLRNQTLPVKTIGDFFFALIEKKITLSLPERRFLTLLSENKKLFLLPEILTEFVRLKAEHLKIQTVSLESAIPLENHFKEQIQAILTKRFEKQIDFKITHNPALLAGIKIRIENNVMDFSVLGKLRQLQHTLQSPIF